MGEKKNHPRAVAYLSGDLGAQIRAEANRLNKPISWVVQECVKRVLPKIKGYPSPDDVGLVPSEERKKGR